MNNNNTTKIDDALVQRQVSKDLIAKRLGIRYSSLRKFGAGEIKSMVNELNLIEEVHKTCNIVMQYLNREQS